MSSKLSSMLKVSAAAEDGGKGGPIKKIVEMDAEGGFDLSAAEAAAEPSLMDELLADATAASAAKGEKLQAEKTRMKSSFGDGMKKSLKKGFFDANNNNKKKKPTKKTLPDEAAPKKPFDVKRETGDGGVASRIKKEVAENLRSDQHPMARKLADGEWVTPDLVEKLAGRPDFARRMNDPGCQAALQAWQKMMTTDPKRAAAMFEGDAELKAFLAEFAEVMGGHFEQLASKEEEKMQDPAEAMAGPMAAKIAKDVAEGRGPAPPRTDEEKKEVEKVLTDTNLRELLMDPATQELMQRCADPRAFADAMRDPEARAIIKRLEDAGLVKLER